MDCERYRTSIAGRLYDENGPEDDAALDAHLALCPACVADLAELTRVRGVLREHEPEVPRVPRVVVLGHRPRFRPALLAASIFGAALVTGGAAGGGYALLHTAAPSRGSAAAVRLDAATEDLIAKEVERRVAALTASRESVASPPTAGADGRPVTNGELQDALQKLERRVNGARAADLDYMMGQVTASEVRSGQRIGQTNQALRYVALASNPHVSEQ